MLVAPPAMTSSATFNFSSTVVALRSRQSPSYLVAQPNVPKAIFVSSHFNLSHFMFDPLHAFFPWNAFTGPGRLPLGEVPGLRVWRVRSLGSVGPHAAEGRRVTTVS